MAQEELSTNGTVYAINERLRTGSIRLIDNRRVQFPFESVRKGAPIPKLREEVDLVAIQTGDGLTAISVNIRTQTSAIKTETLAQSELSFPDLPLEQIVAQDTETIETDNVLPLKFAQKYYEQAAIARAERAPLEFRARTRPRRRRGL